MTVLCMIFNCDKLRAPPPSVDALLGSYHIDQVEKRTETDEPKTVSSHIMGATTKEALQEGAVEAK
jgi:hypothetical protein